MRPRILGVLAVLALVVLLVGVAYLRYGSASNAIAYLNGEYIVADRRIENLGLVEPDKEFPVTFNLTNVHSSPIKLVGANCSCSCILPPAMPMDLAGGETTPVTFNFHSPETAQDFEQLIELYFDGSMPSVHLKITGATK